MRQVGQLPSEVLNRLDRQLNRVRDETGVPGLILAVGQGKRTVLVRGYGTQDGRALEPTVPAMLCSLCKPLTAHAFLLLIEEGKLTLDDPAARWLPVDPAITLRHLLTHRSGLAAKLPESSRAASEAEHLRLALREPLAFTPGTAFLYSNVGYQALGRILEAHTGERPDRFIERRILASLGIKSYFVATYLPPDQQRRYDSGVLPYLTPQHWDKATGQYVAVRDRIARLAQEAMGSADTSGAGCMSAPDYLTFLLSLTSRQRQLIRKSAVDGYGLGWMLRDGGLAHTGIGSGETHYALTRDNGLSVVCFIPSSDDTACEKVLESVKSAVKYIP